MSDTDASSLPSPPWPHQRNFLVVGVVAAAVSAAVAAYVFWGRARQLSPHAETVQELLERCHDQVRDIEQRLGELHPLTQQTS